MTEGEEEEDRKEREGGRERKVKRRGGGVEGEEIERRERRERERGEIERREKGRERRGAIIVFSLPLWPHSTPAHLFQNGVSGGLDYLVLHQCHAHNPWWPGLLRDCR